MWIARALLFLLVMASLSLAPSPKLSIAASPRFGFAPLSTRVKIQIPSDPNNKVACFSYDGPQFSSSCWEHTENSPVTTWKIVENLPAGSYQLSISITKSDGKSQVAHTNVCSLAAGLDTVECSE